MAILKLALGRQNAIGGVVAGVSLDTSGQYGPQYRVDFENGDTFYANVKAFDRQLEFRDMQSPQELVGQAVTFWKKPMPGDPTKGYFNIELGSAPASSGGTQRPSHGDDDYVGRDLRRVGAMAPSTTLEDLVAKYQECLANAHTIVTDYEEAMETKMDAAALTSVAATLFIERNKKGV